MALTKIDDRGLTTPIDLLDNEKIRFGTGNDLELYHDGSNSYIKEAGSGSIITASDSWIYWKNSAADETIIKAGANSQVELYYDNSKKLETNSVGVTVTGGLWVTEDYVIYDNKKLYIGDGNDLQLYHNGSDSYILNSTGRLLIPSAEIDFMSADQNEWIIKSFENGAVELYYDNSKKFETQANGVTVTGGVYSDGLICGDSEIVELGTGGDLQIYHDGNHNRLTSANNHPIIIKAGTGDSYLQGNNVYLSSADGAEVYAKGIKDGAVELYYDGDKRLSTWSDGVNIYGDEGEDAILHLYADDGDDNADKWRIASTHVGNSFTIETYASGSWLKVLSGHDNGACQLHFAGNKKLETTSTGATVTGNLKLASSGNGIMFHPHDETASTPGSDSNLLNDYEEGTFTPSISSTCRSGTITYTNQVGFYTKIGNRVFAQVYMKASGGTNNANQFIVDGLPFSNINTVSWEGGGYHTYMQGFFSTEADRQNIPWVTLNTNYVKFHKISDGDTIKGNDTSTSSNYLIFHVQYVAA